MTEPNSAASSLRDRRGTKRPLVIILITAVMGLGVAVAATATGNEGNQSDISRRAPSVDRDRLLASQLKSNRSSERCLNSLLTVENAGLTLRDETEFRCPGIAAEPGEEHHWGATCWETELCPGGSYIAVDEALIGPDDTRLRYVIAHEICHVNSYMRTGEPGSEPAADECAAQAGFPRR